MGGQEGGKKESKRKERKAKAGRKHEGVGPGKIYAVDGGKISRKRSQCPRCGPGTWLAAHKARSYCGKCGYTEFEKKTATPAHDRDSSGTADD
jgi:small subunit ribosomal protein S27Ae